VAQITISDEVYAQVAAFKQVVEALTEVKLENDTYAEMLLRLAPDYILNEILGRTDAPFLLHTIRQLGHKAPAQVYAHIAQMIDEGQAMAEAAKRTEVRQRLGFKEPES
jgi:predicted CopG family antitoxin